MEMSLPVPDVVDLCSDDEFGELAGSIIKASSEKLKNHFTLQVESEENRNSNVLSTDHEPRRHHFGLSSLYPPSICRQFWKAGNYQVEQGMVHTATKQSDNNHLHVHPMFLHSNATSHKWVFGAIAELVDNAFDEIQNGATFVDINKISNPRDGDPALLIQDDGGGMDPEAMRRCLSFGFSKKKKCAIGQYGNGFKASTMRLGADVIVFSRHMKMRTLTQSAGLLSYTFLRRMGYQKIVVPMVSYEFNASTKSFGPILPHGMEHFSSNLSMLLQWSPYSTQEQLLKQFDDIGHHETKVVVYNLWFNDDGDMELDFDSDVEDIRISGDPKLFQVGGLLKPTFKQHIANAHHYSLCAYLSILYLWLPRCFCIKLRGRVVEHHNIANDLQFPEFIVYRPQSGGKDETAVITTIGFLKEAPDVNIHGFNIYHRNRLILPFLRVAGHIGRGVAGVLEANYIEPTHNKQDFEKTSSFQKLENRLKQMTMEYWHLHCELIGFRVKKPPPALPSQEIQSSGESSEINQIRTKQGLNIKRKWHDPPVDIQCEQDYAADTRHITEDQ